MDLNVDIHLKGMEDLFPPIVGFSVEVIRLEYDSDVDAITTTLGGTGAYSIKNGFGKLTASTTLTIGSKDVSDIRSYSGGLRLGRNWIVGDKNMSLPPYLGVSYFNMDNTIKGITYSPNSFPNGDKLAVRYEAELENADKWSGVLGLNIGLNIGFNFQGEYNGSQNMNRFQLLETYRF